MPIFLGPEYHTVPWTKSAALSTNVWPGILYTIMSTVTASLSPCTIQPAQLAKNYQEFLDLQSTAWKLSPPACKKVHFQESFLKSQNLFGFYQQRDG